MDQPNDVDALVLAATSSVSLRNARKLDDRRAAVGVRAGKENTSIANCNDTTSRWRSKALAALSQLSSLQQRASAAELKACELQLAADQAVLTAQALDIENRSVRAILADVQDERDRLMLEVKLRSIKLTAKPGSAERLDIADIPPHPLTAQDTGKMVMTTKQHVTSEEDHRDIVRNLTAQLDALRVIHEETKLENQSLSLSQQGLKERVTALQELVAKLQDENDYFSSFRAEDVLAQEEEVDVVYGTTKHSDEHSADLRAQLQDRETELLEIYETLDQERERSKSLHEQCVRQAEEMGTLRDRIQAMDAVHRENLDEVVSLRLALDAVKREGV